MDARNWLELATEVENSFAHQQSEDRKVTDILQRTAPVEVGAPAHAKVNRISTGSMGISVALDFAYLHPAPFFHFISPRGEQDRRADKLEHAVNGAFKRAGGTLMPWQDGVFDFIAFGRWIQFLCYAPQFWGKQDYRQRKGEPDGDYIKRSQSLMERDFPLVWRHIDPRSAWPTWGDDGEVDQMFEKRKMTVRQIRKKYGDLDLGYNAKERDERDVWICADDEKIVTIVGGKEPQTAREWEHGLGCNPYVLCKAPPQAPSGNVEFQGALYHAKDAGNALDALVSDMFWNFQQTTRSAMVSEQNPDEVIDTNNQTEVKIEPGVVNVMPPGISKPTPLEPARTNVDGFNLYSILSGVIQSMQPGPVLRGAVLSGQSGATFNSAAQLAINQYSPAVDRLRMGAERLCKVLLRNVEVFDRDIPVFYTDSDNGTFKLNLNRELVEGWENRIQVTIEPAISKNENAELEAWRLTVDPANPLLSWETGAGRFGHVANPTEEWERIQDNQIDRAILQDVIAMVRQDYQAIMADPGSEFAGRVAGLSPALQEAVAIYMGQSQAGGANGAQGQQVARSNANTLRGGQTMNPYEIAPPPMESNVG